MNCAILGATEFEITLLRLAVCGERFAVQKIGIGPRNAQSSIEKLIESNRPDFVIVCGFCGGLQNNLKTGDSVISDSFVSTTEKIESTISTEIKNVILEIAEKLKCTYHYGSTITVEKALLTSKEKISAQKKYNALAVEMENFPIAKTCKEHGIPMISIRAVSDKVDEDLDSRFFNVIDTDGSLRKRKLLQYLVRDPFFMWSLIKTGKASRKARKNYSRLVHKIITHFANQ